MPAPVFTRSIIGSPPNQVTSNEADVAELNRVIGEIYGTANPEDRIRAEESADLAEAWAEGTEPGGAGTKSSREHAEDAAASAAFADSEGNATAAQTARDEAEGFRDEAEAAAANAQASSRTVPTWAALSALTGAVEGEGAEVLDSDTGTHTDPVTSATVDNAGRYSWSESPAGWERIGPTGLTSTVRLTGNQTISGVKTFNDAPEVPSASFPVSAIDGLQDALDGQGSGGRNLALTEWRDVAALALAKSGPYFRLHPEHCFAERDVNATTRVGVGDLVGCLKSADGQFFAIPQQDERRPTLHQNEAGHYYLDGTDANMRVRDSDGNPWDPTTDWTHIGGWRSDPNPSTAAGQVFDGVIFGWAEGAGQSRVVELRGVNNTGNGTRATIAANTFAKIIDDTQDSTAIPHVLRVVKSLADIGAWYNDNPTRRGPPVVPWDDSAVTRSLSLFQQRPDAAGGSNFSGHFYGGLWVPGTLTDAEARFVTAELMRATIPQDRRLVGAKRRAVMDFENDVFQWRGEAKALTDLIDNSDGSYDLTDLSCWDQEHTIIIDVQSDLSAASWSGVFLEFISENGHNEQVLISTTGPAGNRNRNIEYRTPAQGVASPQVGILTRSDESVRCRVAIVVRPGKPIEVYRPDPIASINHRAQISIPPTAIRLRPAIENWTMPRVAIYPEALSGDDLWREMQDGPTPRVHFLADSFGAWGTQDLGRRFTDQTFAAGGAVITSNDPAGGLMFFEPSGRGHTQRFAMTPWVQRATVVLVDGGWNRQEPAYLTHTSLARCLELMRHDPALPKRYILLEPNPITNRVGTAQRDEWDAVQDVVRATVTGGNGPNTVQRYVPTLEAMFGLYQDEDDKLDVLDGIWPRSASSDLTHYGQEGRALYAKATRGRLRDLGYIGGTETANPGAVQNLIATGNVLTWDPPADDGGHPILGYRIQRWSGSAWVTQATQGSPAGFSRQYIREWTAPDAATYRVRAETFYNARVGSGHGNGPDTEVVVS